MNESNADALPENPSTPKPEPVELVTDPIMQYFAYAHLPAKLQAISLPFGKLAEYMIETLPRNPERTVALRKLLESKDAAVRAGLSK